MLLCKPLSRTKSTVRFTEMGLHWYRHIDKEARTAHSGVSENLSGLKGDGIYYPLGFAMAGISDKALKGNYAENADNVKGLYFIK